MAEPLSGYAITRGRLIDESEGLVLRLRAGNGREVALGLSLADALRLANALIAAAECERDFAGPAPDKKGRS